jgi:hypothetical protein
LQPDDGYRRVMRAFLRMMFLLGGMSRMSKGRLQC